MFGKVDSICHNRLAARSLTLATKRANTLTPGKTTLLLTKRAVAKSKRTLGRSAVSHARVYNQRIKRKCPG